MIPQTIHKDLIYTSVVQQCKMHSKSQTNNYPCKEYRLSHQESKPNQNLFYRSQKNLQQDSAITRCILHSMEVNQRNLKQTKLKAKVCFSFDKPN